MDWEVPAVPAEVVVRVVRRGYVETELEAREAREEQEDLGDKGV